MRFLIFVLACTISTVSLFAQQSAKSFFELYDQNSKMGIGNFITKD